VYWLDAGSGFSAGRATPRATGETKAEDRTTLLKDSFFTHNTHVITDGTMTCRYQELPAIFADLDAHFAALGMNAQQTVAYECPNSVPGAVTLLYLLARGYSFVLLPAERQGAKGSVQRPTVPSFCHFHLTIQPNQSLLASIQASPLTGSAESAAGRLYLRTSGSLGASKIVVHQHDKILGNAQNCVHKYAMTASDRMFIPVPIFHMYGMGAAFLPAVLAGASIQIVDKANILKILTYERQFQPNITFLTPDLCEMMVQRKQASNAYRVMVTSGQRIQEPLFEQFNAKFGNCLVNQYGSTELGAIAACSWQDPLEIRIATIGTPMEGVELHLQRIDELTQTGELYCRHPYGYLGYVDETGQWLSQADFWHCTGDLARYVTSSHLKILGRNQDSFNRRGYLVNLFEVAQVLEQLEGVQSVVVFYLEPADKLVACCIASVDSAQIRTACFDRLPAYARPDEVVVAESFPLLASGKIDRHTLHAQVAAQFA